VQTQGSLSDGGLGALLQTMQAERATGTLAIENGGESASLYFLFGHLFHASGPRGQGEDVVVDALGWDAGSYQFDPRAKLPAEETIKSSPAELISVAQSRQPAAAGGWPEAPAAEYAPPFDEGAAAGEPVSPPEEPAYAPYTPPEAAPSYVPEMQPATAESGLASWEATQEETVTPAPEPLTYTTPAAAPYEPAAYEPAAYEPAPAPIAPAREEPPAAPRAPYGSRETSATQVVYPLPAGRAHYEGLKSAFVDFPRLLRTLRSDRHTGYVRLTGSGYSGFILLDEGQPLEAVCNNGSVVQGEDSFLQIRRHMDNGDGMLDVIELSGDIVQALARLFTGPPIFTGLLGRFVNLDALLEYLAEEQLDGSVIVTGANEVGVILMSQGGILGAYTESQSGLDKATTAVAALAAERTSQIEVKGGASRVTPIDVDAALSRPY
jgi:Domain of unknown function (DUF4388)